jgi:hypothetical protein
MGTRVALMIFKQRNVLRFATVQLKWKLPLKMWVYQPFVIVYGLLLFGSFKAELNITFLM